MALTKISTDTIDLSSDTTALKMPKGTTAQRPGEILSSVDYLIVAGGGGGGNFGGGGGGGLLTTYTPVTGTTPGQSQTQISLTVGTTYTITIGDGGTGNTAYGSLPYSSSGDDSTISGSDITTITATGGGGGNKSSANTSNIDGGSGGGSGWNVTTAPAGSASTPTQGYDGGDGYTLGSSYVGGGGGGASQTPATGTTGTPGPGGEGTTIAITGSSVGYAGGGGGVGFETSDGTGAAPSVGGGGAGSTWNGNAGATLSPVYAGTDGKGGGGGSGGDGGCGIVYIRLPGITSGDVTILSGSAAKGNVSSDAFVKLDTAGTATFKITSNGETSTTGTLRENTTTGKMEIYTGDAGWRALQQTGQDTGVVPSNNFNTVLYTGNDSTNPVSVGFAPDFSWIKCITDTRSNTLIDTVRGATNVLQSESASQEWDGSSYVQSFDANGFTVKSNAAFINSSSQNYVSWNWKAGGAPTVSNPFMIDDVGYASAALASMNIGTITPNACSVNTEAGFSIVKFTGTGNASDTVSHGLGAAPNLVMYKDIDNTRNWNVYVSSAPSIYNPYGGILDLNYAFNTGGGTNGSAGTPSPTVLTFTAGSSTVNTVNALNQEIITYSWRSIPGYSLIGSYMGTGSSTNTPIIYTGFEPAWIMVKCVDSARAWNITDNKRNTTNPRDSVLQAQSTDLAYTSSNYNINFYNDGFQIVNANTGWNIAGETYIFMCFAA